MFRNFKLCCCCITNRFSTNICSNGISLPKETHIAIVQKFLGCSEKDALEGLMVHGSLQLLSKEELNYRLGILHEKGIVDSHYSDSLCLAKHHPSTMKNRFMALEEYGFRRDMIKSTSVRRFLSLTHMQIHTLKTLLLIEKETDVYKQMLSHGDLEKYYNSYTEDKNLISLKLQTLRILLKTEIGMTDEILDRKYEILKRLKNKSIRLIRKNIHIAKNIIKYPTNKICRNPFMLWADPDNTLRVINEIKEIAGVDIRICMALYPKIISGSYDNFKRIIDCLHEYNISDDAIKRGLCLFTLSSETVRERLQELVKEELFPVFKHHPGVLLLVYYYNKVKLRLKLLKELNVANASLQVIFTSNQKCFDRYYEHGALRNSGNDIVQYIISEFECTKQEVRNKISSFEMWQVVPAIEIAKNVQYLRDRGFSNTEIFNCLHVLFYHNSRIIKELEALEHKENTECCRENGAIKREFILPLLVYFLELSFNFSSHCIQLPEDIDDETTHKDIVIPKYKTITNTSV